MSSFVKEVCVGGGGGGETGEGWGSISLYSDVEPALFNHS